MKSFIGLVRREVWEHPSLFMAPLGVNIFVAMTFLIAVARAIGSEEQLRNIVNLLSMANDAALEAGRTILFLMPVVVVVIVTIVVGYYYFIDCLFAERKERTILFFKSFPVSNAETVLSKLFAGVVLLPFLSIASFVLTQLFVLAVASIALWSAGGSPTTLWSAGGLASNWLLALYLLVSSAIWYSPFIAFFVLVSGWAKKSVALWSMAPLFLAYAEALLPGPDIFGTVIVAHVRDYFTSAFALGINEFANTADDAIEQFGGQLFGNGYSGVLSLADPVSFVSAPALWGGMIVAVALTMGAIYLRRYRDDS